MQNISRVSDTVYAKTSNGGDICLILAKPVLSVWPKFLLKVTLLSFESLINVVSGFG